MLIAVIISTFFSSILMEYDVWIPLHLGNITMFLGCGLILLLPNTKRPASDQEQEYELLAGSEESIASGESTVSEESSIDELKSKTTHISYMESMRTSALGLQPVFRDRNVLLLLALSFANTLGTDVQDIVLQYMSKLFELKFSEVSLESTVVLTVF